MTTYTDTVPARGSRSCGPFVVIGLLVVAVLAVFMTASHASNRHGAVADRINQNCTPNSYMMHFKRLSDNRDAFLCQLDGVFVFSIRNFDPANVEKYGDDIVTAFERKQANTIQDAIDYITCTKNGIPVPNCGVKGGGYIQVP